MNAKVLAKLSSYCDERSKVHNAHPDWLVTMLTKEGPELIEAIQASGKEKRLTYYDLADLVGMSPSYISQVKTGRRIISPRAYMKLIQVKQ